MGCASQIPVQLGTRVDHPVIFTDGLDGPQVAVTNLAINNAVKSAGGNPPAGIDPASITSTIIQAQDDTPADIPGLAILNFDTTACIKGDVVTITAQGEGAGGAIATVVKSFRIIDDPAQRLVAC